MNDTNSAGLSADQLRYQFLTKQVGLEHEEALHAIGRRNGGWPKYRGRSRQEQFTLMQVYVEHGLTEDEARSVIGIPSGTTAPSTKSKSVRAKKAASLDWMPAKKAFDLPTPGRSKKGLLG